MILASSDYRQTHYLFPLISNSLNLTRLTKNGHLNIDLT